MYEQTVKKVVKEYKKVFPQEYKAVIELVKEKRKMLQNSDTGQMKGDHVLERPIAEYPETLYTAIYNELTPQAFTAFSTTEGQRWFVKTYPEFRIPRYV